MLYSESKERENRFIISLKIGFPFLILTLLLFYIFKVSADDLESFSLFLILTPIYIYYVFYLIYRGFKSSLIDPTTKTFTRQEIFERIKKIKQKKFESIVVLIKVDNIVDINERYGISNADKILRIFTKNLNDFLENYNFKNIAIGRYAGGHFLLVLKGREKELKHLITIFSKELKNIGIDDIEIKIDYSLINSNYDENVENIVKQLIIKLDKHSEIPDIKPNEFEEIVCDSIKSEKFLFKYQPLKAQNSSIEILEVLTKIYSKKEGMLSKNQIQKVINSLGKEMIFDKKVMENLLKEIKNLNLTDRLISIKISPVTLRNTEFRLFLTTLFYNSNIKPENIILEFSEKRAYKETQRFKEILTQYKKSGFKIGLDNFGGNNSSLEYIKTLPIDIVKFDIEFTKHIDDEKYKEMIKAYITLLHNLHVEAVIKFIDKKEIFEKVEKFGFDYIEGFLISKPKNINQLNKIEEN